MSNLYRNSYVVNSNTVKRVINSNSLIAEKLKERENQGGLRFQSFDNQLAEENESEAGFVDGISAEVVEVEPEPEITAEDLLEDAKREAEEILLNARREAEAIRSQAMEEAESLKADAKASGYQEGLAEKEQELVEKEAAIEETIMAQQEELEQAYQLKENTMEADILDAIIQVVERVFHVEFQNRKEILLALVKNTLLNIEVGKSFRLRMSEENHSFVESKLDEIKQRIGNDIAIEIVNDASLSENDCLIETDFGIFDCGIDREMDNLVKDIRALCS